MSKLSQWLENNCVSIAIAMATYIMILATAIIFSWLFGYWYNGLTKHNFEISSCWQGLAAVGASFISPILVAFTGNARYKITSMLNTMPYSSLPKEKFIVPKAGTNTEQPL